MKTLIATAVTATALAAPAAAQACKPATHIPTQVSVRSKPVAPSGPFCAARFRTVRVVVYVEGRRVVITIRVPRKQRPLPSSSFRVIR